VIEKTVSIVGTGYVGLCTAVGFASKGYKVVASTHDPEKAESINAGIPPFFEYSCMHGREPLGQKMRYA